MRPLPEADPRSNQDFGVSLMARSTIAGRHGCGGPVQLSLAAGLVQGRGAQAQLGKFAALVEWAAFERLWADLCAASARRRLLA
jgi:hypothetical protein